MSKVFIQPFPKLLNTFDTDDWAQFYLAQSPLDSGLHTQKNELSVLGHLAAFEMEPLSYLAEQNPPRLESFDAWGNQVDIIHTHPSWDKMQDFAATQGIIATGYERKLGSWSRVLQMLSLYLYHPSSAIFSCPLAMTDGAARLIEVQNDMDLKNQVLPHLISRDPKQFWTSGQWMTEQSGGSDVSNTLTEALPDQGPWYKLNGIKWFTSATTSQVAFALARIQGAPAGNKGLSLFYVPVRKSDGSLNHIKIQKLKNKFGTWALPTAELVLTNTPAKLIGEPGQGIKNVSTLLNITRLYNTICSLGYLTRALDWMDLYSTKRQAFGRPLFEHPLHQQTFLPLHALKWGLADFTFSVIHWWGEDECSQLSKENQTLLRLYTPLLKLYSGKKVVEVTTEVMEGFGGQGYIEDTPIPRIVANSHVLPIWEGTTNVLSLDVWRVFQKENAFSIWISHQSNLLKSLDSIDEKAANIFRSQLQAIEHKYHRLENEGIESSSVNLKELCFAIMNISIAIHCHSSKFYTASEASLQKMPYFKSRSQKEWIKYLQAFWIEASA